MGLSYIAPFDSMHFWSDAVSNGVLNGDRIRQESLRCRLPMPAYPVVLEAVRLSLQRVQLIDRKSDLPMEKPIEWIRRRHPY